MEEKVNNRIGRDFSTFELFKFVLPAFLMNVFTQVYRSLDDALFISRYIGEKALAGFNILNPINSIQLALTHLFALGSSNISAKLMGQGKQKDAKQVFTKLVIVAGLVGMLLSILLNIFPIQILKLLKADDELISYAIYQLRIVLSLTPLTLMSAVFTNYYATAGKPHMGMICSITQGVLNIVLDFILIVYLKIGVLGAAIATAAGEIAIFLIGLVFFLNKNNEIHFVKPEGEFIYTCLDSFKYALPQFINGLSFAITILYTNYLLLEYVGSVGLAANAVISDVRSIVTAGLIGVAAASSPVVAYNFGNKNPKQLKKNLISIFKIWFYLSFSLIALGLVIRKPLVSVFMSKTSSKEFYDMTLLGLTIELFSVPLVSGCVTTSRIFIAFGNAKIASFLSVFRNLIIKLITLFIFSKLFEVVGIWLALPIGELIAFVVCIYLLYINRNNYGYGKDGIATYM